MSKSPADAAAPPSTLTAVPSMPRVLDAASEESRAKEVARRLGLTYVDLAIEYVAEPKFDGLAMNLRY